MLYVVIATLGRLIPHMPNFTPTTNLCVFAGKNLNKGLAILLTLVAIFLSDIGLSYIYGYKILGLWSLFTYSGFVAMILFGSWSKNKNLPIVFTIIFSELGFWAWTNFGSWLINPMYSKNTIGLMNCCIAGLPFLRNALMGDMVWMVVIFVSFAWVKKTSFLVINTSSWRVLGPRDKHVLAQAGIKIKI